MRLTPSAPSLHRGDLERSVAAVLDRRLDPGSAAPLALGLSGGGDSLALLLLVARWARTHGRPLLALTVDHGLHPDSPRWTAFAGEAARRAGADWRALRWEGDKPAAGLPAAARAARHRLLATAARQAGASVLLLGHTLDDRREAALMRARDTPVLGEMAEWAPSPAWPEGRGIFLLRPLLEVGRAALRETLTEEGQTWLDDPANDDPRYARARARADLDGAPPLPADGALPSPVEMKGVSVTGDGRVLADRAALRRLGPGPLKRLVSAALLCASGTDAPPRGVRLERLVQALAGTAPFAASLCGARAAADGEGVSFGREAGERARGGLAALPLPRGRPMVWDGRFEIVAEAEGLEVGPLAGRIGALARAERSWLKTLPPPARSALPVIAGAAGRAALPHPFGAGPAIAACLVEARLLAACGLLDREGTRSS